MKSIILVFMFTFIIVVNGLYASESECTIDDTTGCAKRAYEKSDKELNHVYVIIKKWIGKKLSIQLKNAEIAWLKYRDLNCESEKDFISLGVLTGPEMVKNAKLLCLERMTTQRIKEIKRVYSWGRGFPFNNE